tara:strand:- start:356 stop:556 length:201 start_codon:yes stop_codon:yes gene_type:complete
MSLHELVQKKLKLEHQWANQALTQKQVTPDMRWIDLEVKDLKIQINDQCETDAKEELIVESNKIDT